MKKIGIVFIALIVYTSPSYAQTYIGIASGTSNVNAPGYNSGVPGKLYFGYAFNDTTSIELSFTKLGEFDLSATDTRIEKGTEILLRQELVQSGNINLFAKVGYYSWEAFTVSSGTVFVGTIKNGNSLTYGLGMNMAIGKKLQFVAEYQHYREVDGVNFNTMGIGISKQF